MLRRVHIAVVCVFAAACGGTSGSETTTPQADPATTGTITGKVHDRASGEELSFATVMAVQPASENPPENTDTTNAHGEFRIDGLEPGTYRVSVYYSNVSARWQDIEVKAGDEVSLAIDLNLAGGESAAPVATAGPNAATRTADASSGRRGAITGQVLDQANGDKLEGAVVAATAPTMRDAQMAVTDENGKFRIGALPPGTYKLSCYYRLVDYGDIEVQRLNIEVAGGETTTVPIRLDTSVTAAPGS
jgi:uncharacterized surface anchored protein